MKIVLLTAAAFLLMNQLFAQESIADKGALILGGTISYYYQHEGNNNVNLLNLNASVDKLIAKHVFVGAIAGYLDRNANHSISTTYQIGPRLGYIWGKTESKVFPFISTGYFFQKYSNSADNNQIFAKAGVIVPLKKHCGLTIGWNLAMWDFGKDYHRFSFTSDLSNFSVGITGLFYKGN